MRTGLGWQLGPAPPCRHLAGVQLLPDRGLHAGPARRRSATAGGGHVAGRPAVTGGHRGAALGCRAAAPSTEAPQEQRQSNGKAAAGASNGKSNGRAPSSNGKPLGPANTTTEAADQAQDSKEDTNGKPASASREVASMTDMVRQEEQSEYMAGQGAQAGADPDNAPHPASSWLPYSPPAEPRPPPNQSSGQRLKAQLSRVRGKILTVPDYIGSQITYRVQQLMLGNTVVKLLAVFLSALPVVLVGGEIYSHITGDPLAEGFLKIFSVLYIIPGVNVAGESNPLSWLLLNSTFLLGTFTFAVILGVVSDDITQEVKSIREGNYAVMTKGHILLLNWNRQTPPLLRQLALAQKEQFTAKPRDVVVLADKDKGWMDDEMKLALRGYNISWQTRQGSPYAAADLLRVSAGSASMIVLMRPESGEHIAAREVSAIVGIHALRGQMSSKKRHRQSMIVQAPEDGTDVVAAAKRVLKSSALESLGLQDKRDIAMLIAQSALQPGVASVHCAILQKSPTGVSLYLRHAAAPIVGRHFRYARRCFSDAVLVGVFSGRDRRPYLNPGDDMEIHEGDRLIVLSQTSFFRPNKAGPLHVYHEAAAKRSSPGQLFLQRRNDITPAPIQPRNIVVAGWCGGTDYLVQGMTAFAPEGSVVTIICECNPEGMPMGKQGGVTFQHLPGYPHNTMCLEEAGIRTADAVIIGPADDLPDKEADAQLLSMIMLVQDILLDDLAHSSHSNGSGSNGGSNGLVPHQRNLDVKAPTHVVGVVRCPPSVEVANYMVRDLARNCMTAELLQPDELVSGLMAQVAAEPDLALVLPLLIDSWEGNTIRLREPEELGIGDLHATNFAEVVERAALIDECAIGYVTRVGTLVLAPHVSSEKVYRNTDRIVVFASSS